MAPDTDITSERPRSTAVVARGPLDNMDNLDRILLGACAAGWLVALGAVVAATVALVDLGRAGSETPQTSDTPWLLYTVIAVSAVVIAGAVPLLLRARRSAIAEPPAVQAAAPAADPAVRGGEAPTEKLQTLRMNQLPTAHRPGYTPAPRRAGLPAPLVTAIDRIWLRCALGIGCAMGTAMVAVGVGTYLMAVDKTMAAWVVYGVAGAIIVGMPAIPWFHLRQLRDVLDGAKTESPA